MTAEQVAERLAEVGVSWQRSTLAKLENGNRENVTVGELLALAYVLGVAPVHLLIDPNSEDLYAVTPSCSESSADVRSWVRGFRPLEGMDARLFWAEVPPAEFGVQEDAPGRRKWLLEVISYASRSMGRLYRRDDGSTVLEIEQPRREDG
jgi:transcriptional regulator with XRE-family HTH domain